MEKKIILIGGGGHAKVLLDMLNLSSYLVVGYFDFEEKDLFGIDYLGNDENIKKYRTDEVALVNCIGSVKLPVDRKRIFEKFKELGYGFHSVIHPKAIISPYVDFGEGVQIMGGVVVNVGSKIHHNVIINTSASIDHDCIIQVSRPTE